MVTRANRGADAPTESAPGDQPPGDAPPPAPPGDQKPPEKAADEGSLKLPPAEWGKRKGLLFAPSERQPWVESFAKEFHQEADNLHGWSEHAHHYQPAQRDDGTFDMTGVFVLTEADYDAARKAASQFPAVGPHEPALALLKDRPKPQCVKETRAQALEAAKVAKAKRAEQRKAMR